MCKNFSKKLLKLKKHRIFATDKRHLLLYATKFSSECKESGIINKQKSIK